MFVKKSYFSHKQREASLSVITARLQDPTAELINRSGQRLEDKPEQDGFPSFSGGKTGQPLLMRLNFRPGPSRATVSTKDRRAAPKLALLARRLVQSLSLQRRCFDLLSGALKKN